MQRYYFDYAAGTPVDPIVEKAMRPYWAEKSGNPGSLHFFGQEASAGVFNARDTIAKALGCNYKEVIFTGSATEANNLAVRGVVRSFRLKFPGIKPKIIVSTIEHESVLETARDLERDGVEVVYLPVDKNGLVDLKKLKDALDERTILVSVMYVNNEVGSIQPIKMISDMVKNFRGSNNYPLFHTDAVQAFNYLNCNVNDLGVDLLTLSSQKIYGPKGCGLLYIRSQKLNVKSQMLGRNFISPIITGGSAQEYGLRAGTENVPAIVGFGKAIELVSNSRELENKRLRKLQEYFLAQMKKIAPKAKLNGPENLKNRIPNNLNFYFPSRENESGTAQDLLIKLDLAGFAVSPGAACTARTCQPSHVLKAMGYSDERATSSLRFTFGRPIFKSDIDKLLNEIKKF
ncbi:MAG: cysteine desulfurase family protein [bacterium]|nr:cysteine desulfurase family protein [bacterium]